VQKYWSGAVTVKQSCGARQTIKNSLFGFNSNGPLNHGKEGKTRYYVIQCRFSEFLIQLCIKIRSFFLVRADILLPCAEKLPFFWVCAEILLSRDKVSLESRAGPFLGVVKKY